MGYANTGVPRRQGVDRSRLARTIRPVSHVDFQAREVLLLLYLFHPVHPHEAWPASKVKELGVEGDGIGLLPSWLVSYSSRARSLKVAEA